MTPWATIELFPEEPKKVEWEWVDYKTYERLYYSRPDAYLVGAFILENGRMKKKWGEARSLPTPNEHAKRIIAEIKAEQLLDTSCQTK